MKKIIFIILTAIVFSGCNTTHGQNKEIESFVKEIIASYNSKNSEKFNQFINKKEGIVFVTTIGANNNWENVRSVCLQADCLNNGIAESIGIPYQSFLEEYKTGNLNLSKIEFTEESFFECEKIEKEGIFVSSENKFHTLSKSVKFFAENYASIIGEELDVNKKNELERDFEKFEKLEQNSRRITVNSESGTFIFYITNISGKWYLTIIDFASIDCSV